MECGVCVCVCGKCGPCVRSDGRVCVCVCVLISRKAAPPPSGYPKSKSKRSLNRWAETFVSKLLK